MEHGQLWSMAMLNEFPKFRVYTLLTALALIAD